MQISARKFSDNNSSSYAETGSTKNKAYSGQAELLHLPAFEEYTSICQS